jgi:hypothetical protein
MPTGTNIKDLITVQCRPDKTRSRIPTIIPKVQSIFWE